MQRTGSYAYLPLERVVFGRPAAEAAVEEATRIGATRVFIVAWKSLATKTPGSAHDRQCARPALCRPF
jgi:maleylacetate reductase